MKFRPVWKKQILPNAVKLALEELLAFHLHLGQYIIIFYQLHFAKILSKNSKTVKRYAINQETMFTLECI